MPAMKNLYNKLKLGAYNSYLLFIAYLDARVLRISHRKLGEFFRRTSDELLILGTGPSLSTLNFDVLKEVDSLSVNGYARLVTESNWPETDLYMIQDVEVFRRLKKDIQSLGKSKIFLSHLLTLLFKNDCNRLKNSLAFRHHLLNHAYVESYEGLNVKVSDSPECIIYDGYTVVFSAIQLAVALGYSKVYLLGVDANYSKDIKNRNIVDIGKRDDTYSSAGDRICFGIKKLVDAYPDLEIYNCSRTSALTFLRQQNTLRGHEISS